LQFNFDIERREQYKNKESIKADKNVEIKRTKVIESPDAVLNEYLNNPEIKLFKMKEVGILGITIVGYKV